MPRWQDIADDREKYAAYLCSREWGVLKRAVHERAKGHCERCDVPSIDAVHHLTYARKYKEKLEDLEGLCKSCHEYTHGKSDIDPADNAAILSTVDIWSLDESYLQCAQCLEKHDDPEDMPTCMTLDGLAREIDHVSIFFLCKRGHRLRVDFTEIARRIYVDMHFNNAVVD